MQELRVAIIGAGFMGKAHSLAWSMAPIIETLRCKISKRILVDIDPEIAKRAASDYGWLESHTDWRSVVTDPEIDIVDICTPPQYHAEIAELAADNGKHVFIEKPITNSAEEADRICTAISRNNVVGQIGYNYRHSPAVEYTKRLMTAGSLGEPLQFRASYLQEAIPRPAAQDLPWRARKQTGGSGTVGDIGSHVIDSAEYLFGDITRVAARVRSGSWVEGWVSEEQRIKEDRVDNAGVWVAEFANGSVGTFAVNGLSSGRKNRLHWELDCSKAAVEFNWNHREQFRISYVDEQSTHRGFRTVYTNTEHPDGVWDLAGLGLGYTDISAIQFIRFIRQILGEPQDVPTPYDGAHVQHVVEAIYKAATSDSWVDVQPRKEAK